MKSYNVDRLLTDPDVVHAAVVSVCKGKKKKNGRPTSMYKLARKILANPKPTEERVIRSIEQFGEKMHAIYTGTYVEGDYPDAYVPSPNYSFITTCDNGKVRRITDTKNIHDHFVREVVSSVMQSTMVPSMHPYTCGSIKGRGLHRAVKRMKRFIYNSEHCNKSDIKYVAQLDVRKCFPHIPHAPLKYMLKKKFRGHLLVDLCSVIIDSYHEPGTELYPLGLPIGFVTSPTLCNLYLTPIDMYANQICKSKCYIRYIDDIVFFGRSKKDVHLAVNKIAIKASEYGLPLKHTWQVFRFDYTRDGVRKGRPLDVLGYRFYRDKTILRKNKSLKLKRKARRIAKSNFITPHNAMAFMSSAGALRHCDSRNLWTKQIKPYVNIKRVKEVIRNESRRLLKTECHLDRACLE